MVTDKDRMIEWLTRTADEVNSLRRKPKLSTEKALSAIRQNYNVLSVLIQVAEGKAFLMGIAPPPEIP